MAQSDRRSTPKDSVDTEADPDAAADDVTDDVTSNGESDATVSETGSLAQEPAGDSDAPDDGPHPTADVADADPRSSATAGSKKKKATAKKSEAGDEEKPATKGSGSKGKASKSGDPARKKAAAEEKKPSKVSRTPVKPKRLQNRWAAPMMLACAGIGLAWIVVFYVTQDRVDIPWYSDLGSWNLVIGMGFIVAAFGFSMKWE